MSHSRGGSFVIPIECKRTEYRKLQRAEPRVEDGQLGRCQARCIVSQVYNPISSQSIHSGSPSCSERKGGRDD